MSFDLDFLDMMKDTVIIAPFTGIDTYNRPTFGAAVSYRARIAGKDIALRAPTSENNTPIFDIWVYSRGVLITIDDKLTLPNDPAWRDRTPVIFAVGAYTDEDSTHHAKIQCGWMYHRQGQ